MTRYFVIAFFIALLSICGCSNRWNYTPWWAQDPDSVSSITIDDGVKED